MRSQRNDNNARIKQLERTDENSAHATLTHLSKAHFFLFVLGSRIGMTVYVWKPTKTANTFIAIIFIYLFKKTKQQHNDSNGSEQQQQQKKNSKNEARNEFLLKNIADLFRSMN